MDFFDSYSKQQTTFANLIEADEELGNVVEQNKMVAYLQKNNTEIYILKNVGDLVKFPGLYKKWYSFQPESKESLPSITSSGLPSNPVITLNNP